jgi:hypothetical protein
MSTSTVDTKKIDTPGHNVNAVDTLCPYAQVDTTRLTLDEVKGIILGPQGTCVTLGIQSWRTGERYSVTVRRHWELDEEDIPGASQENGLLDDIFRAAGKGINVGVKEFTKDFK